MGKLQERFKPVATGVRQFIIDYGSGGGAELSRLTGLNEGTISRIKHERVNEIELGTWVSLHKAAPQFIPAPPDIPKAPVATERPDEIVQTVSLLKEIPFTERSKVLKVIRKMHQRHRARAKKAEDWREKEIDRLSQEVAELRALCLQRPGSMLGFQPGR